MTRTSKQASLVLIPSLHQSLSNTTLGQYINASSPNEMEESDGKSIPHLFLSVITLKGGRCAFHKGLLSKWDWKECETVYSSFQLLSLTLKSRRLALHKRLIAKWNGSQSRQVYSSFSFYGSSLWKEEDALSIKACFPNEIEKSARQSILHFSICQSLSKGDDLHFTKVSSPNETEESAGKSIPHSTLYPFTLKHCIGTTQACSCVKWNGSQCRQVYFWITAFKDSLSNTTLDESLKELTPIATDFKLAKSIVQDHQLKWPLNSNEASRKQPTGL